MFNLENLLRIVVRVALSVLTVDLILVAFILRRRLSRWLYYNNKDAAMKRFNEPVRDFLAGKIPVEDLVAILRPARRRAARVSPGLCRWLGRGSVWTPSRQTAHPSHRHR